jgi:hypothetical protein
LLSAICVSATAQSQYSAVFGEDYEKALTYMQINRLLMHKVFEHNGVPADVLVPVIFPERIRYSIIRDYIETESMKYFYVNEGSDFADFSVGDFQLKASFAEETESFIRKNPELKEKYSLLIISNENNKKARETRIKRLQNTAYQLFYISAFYDIVNHRFDISRLSKEEQIRFTASAYNHGFTKSKESIERYANLKFFPYGSSYPGKQYAYSDIAYDFYLHYYKSTE